MWLCGYMYGKCDLCKHGLRTIPTVVTMIPMLRPGSYNDISLVPLKFFLIPDVPREGVRGGGG